jgi:urate oxidase
MRGSAEQQTAHVERAQNAPFVITAGFEDLILLKTADSCFSGFLRDELTTLPDCEDRLLGTSMRSSWTYLREPKDFDGARRNLRETMLRSFARHNSRSVQQTMYAMGEAALLAESSIDQIDLAMPNKHCLLVDLSRFGQDNPNEIFVPTDEPHGYLEARVRRRSES